MFINILNKLIILYTEKLNNKETINEDNLLQEIIYPIRQNRSNEFTFSTRSRIDKNKEVNELLVELNLTVYNFNRLNKELRPNTSDLTVLKDFKECIRNFITSIRINVSLVEPIIATIFIIFISRREKVNNIHVFMSILNKLIVLYTKKLNQKTINALDLVQELKNNSTSKYLYPKVFEGIKEDLISVISMKSTSLDKIILLNSIYNIFVKYLNIITTQKNTSELLIQLIDMQILLSQKNLDLSISFYVYFKGYLYPISLIDSTKMQKYIPIYYHNIQESIRTYDNFKYDSSLISELSKLNKFNEIYCNFYIELNKNNQAKKI